MHMPRYFAAVKILERIPAWLRDRHSVAVLGLLCWIAFFDRNDAWTTFKNWRELARMNEQREFYQQEITRSKEQIIELSSNKRLLEKFARERYLMKRDNEDIFVLVPAKKD